MDFKGQLKFTATLLLVGFGLGLVASMFWGPGLISWWWKPPGDSGVNLCGEQVLDSTRMLVQMQMWTGLGLGVFATVIGHLVAYKRRPVIVQAGAQAATQSMTTTSPPTEPPSGP
jgi:hypothetical protein